MRSIRAFVCFTSLISILCPALASAIGTVTDGDVTFGYSFDFNTTAGNTVDTEFIAG